MKNAKAAKSTRTETPNLREMLAEQATPLHRYFAQAASTHAKKAARALEAGTCDVVSIRRAISTLARAEAGWGISTVESQSARVTVDETLRQFTRVCIRPRVAPTENNRG